MINISIWNWQLKQTLLIKLYSQYSEANLLPRQTIKGREGLPASLLFCSESLFQAHHLTKFADVPEL
jgi:hypothetical protein